MSWAEAKKTPGTQLVPVSAPKPVPRQFEVSEAVSVLMQGKKKQVKLHLEYEDPLQAELSAFLRSRVLGQEESMDQISKIVSSRLSQIGDREAPVAVLYLGGPTGVGKTETAHALAEFFLGNPKGFTKIHGEDYQDHHTSRNLFGSPKSYVGYDDPPKLNDAEMQSFHRHALESGQTHQSVSAHSKFAIVLVDEIDKVHHSITQNFLGIFDKGFFELPNGSENDPDLPYSKYTDFRQTIFILTSNAGEAERREMLDKRPMGFAPATDHSTRHSETAEVVQRALKRKFSPEFIERIDAFLSFKPLTLDTAEGIVRKGIERLRDGFLKRKLGSSVAIDVRPETVRSVAKAGLDPLRGARNLNRFAEEHLIIPLRGLILSGQISGIPEGKTATLRVDGEFDSLNATLLSFRDNETENVLDTSSSVVNRRSTVVGRIEDAYSKIAAYRRVYELALVEHFSISSELARLEQELLACGIPQEEIERVRNEVVEEIERRENERQVQSVEASSAATPLPDALTAPLPDATELFYPISPEAILDTIRYYVRNADKILRTPVETHFRNTLVVLTIREACERLVGKELTKDQYDYVSHATHEIYLRMKAKTR